MNKFTLLKNSIILILIIFCNSSSAQFYKWAKRTGGTDSDHIHSIKADTMGNVYCVGRFRLTIDLDPGSGIDTITQVGNPSGQNTFIQKLDSSGNYLWGGHVTTDLVNMDIDAAGNLYLTGDVYDTVDVDFGTWTYNLYQAQGRVYILKVNANGMLGWVKQFSDSYNTHSTAIAITGNGDVYIGGSFKDTTDFDPGPGTFVLTVLPFPTAGYILKLNSSGNFIWVKQFNGTVSSAPSDLCVDAAGNVYGTAGFYGTIDFDPGSGFDTLTCVGLSTDIYTFKLDANGNHVWARLFTGYKTDNSYGVAVSPAGDTYVVGLFDSTLNFNPAGSGFFLDDFDAIGGAYDVFVAKFNPSGNFEWAKQFGGTTEERGYDIASDAAGNAYATGYFMSPDFDCDPNAGAAIYTGNSLDGFTVKVDPQGNYMWSQAISSQGAENTLAVFVDNRGNIYTGGNFEQTIDFDLGTGVANLTSAGVGDAYIQKLGQLSLTGLQENHIAHFISVYPNPVTSELTIEMERKNFNDCKISLSDLSGQPLPLPVTNSGQAGNRIKISIDELPKGIYFLKVCSVDGNDFFKVVKQ